MDDHFAGKQGIRGPGSRIREIHIKRKRGKKRDKK
jgi:hypothetical protein